MPVLIAPMFWMLYTVIVADASCEIAGDTVSVVDVGAAVMRV